MKALIRLKFRIIKNRLAGLKNESLFKIFFVLLFAIGLLLGIYKLSLEVFRLLEHIEGLSRILIDRLIYLFFFSLSFMLILSSAIWGYTTLYKTKEVRFLFTLPLEQNRIFILKFLETVLLSGWAFLFLSFPFMYAYGYFRHLAGTFYVYLVISIIPLFFLCTSTGILFSMILVRFFPRRRGAFFFVTLLSIVGLWFFFKISRQGNLEDENISFFLTRVFPYIKLSQNKFLPSFWVTEGLMELSYRRFKEGVFWWGLLLSNALLLTMVCFELANRIFYRGWERLACLSHIKRVVSYRMYLRRMAKLFRLPGPAYALLNKDICIARRTPEQNLQFLFFFGLLGIYFSNLRNLSYHTFIPKWKAIVQLLNITATQLTLGSFVLRFIFPQISLEGTKFWILGLSPMRRTAILWEKFFLSWIISLSITLGLICVSNSTLKVDSLYVWISILVTVLSSLTITAISCGLGAVFANFKEDNPAVIVSGFGGTFTLVLTLFYIALMIFLISPPFYLYLVSSIPWEAFKAKVILSGFLLLLFSFLISFTCLLLGKKKLERAEF